MSDFHDQRPPLIEGEYYDGAFGPSILLTLTSRESIPWLREIFENRAGAPSGDVLSLVSQPEAQIGASVGDLVLCRVSRRPEKHLVREYGERFVWSATADEWETMSLLLDPLLERAGHQYLTDEGDDDALIEISFGEVRG